MELAVTSRVSPQSAEDFQDRFEEVLDVYVVSVLNISATTDTYI